MVRGHPETISFNVVKIDRVPDEPGGQQRSEYPVFMFWLTRGNEPNKSRLFGTYCTRNRVGALFPNG
jgi:hypothetical protein